MNKKKNFVFKIFLLTCVIYFIPVFKRDAKPLANQGKFAQYIGKGIVEFDLVNIGEIDEYEMQHLK